MSRAAWCWVAGSAVVFAVVELVLRRLARRKGGAS